MRSTARGGSGTAGDAFSNAIAESLTNGLVEASSEAHGGSVSRTASSPAGLPFIGGSARAAAEAIGGHAIAHAWASGGWDRDNNNNGDGEAHAVARGTRVAQASTRSSGAAAYTNSARSIIQSPTASAPAVQAVFETEGGSHTSFQRPSEVAQATAHFAAYSPRAWDRPAVNQLNVAVGGSSTLLAETDIRLATRNMESEEVSRRAFVEVALQTPTLSAGETLELVFNEFDAVGDGVVSIGFRVAVDTTVVAEEAFATTAEAAAYFSASGLDLSAFAGAVTARTLSYSISTISTSGADADYVATRWSLVIVPEPGTGLLVLLGLAGLARRPRVKAARRH